jgi:hypothetical protein
MRETLTKAGLLSNGRRTPAGHTGGGKIVRPLFCLREIWPSLAPGADGYRGETAMSEIKQQMLALWILMMLLLMIPWVLDPWMLQ